MIGSWTLTANQALTLNGKTISYVLAKANDHLAGLRLPPEHGTPGNWNELVNQLNLSFLDDGTVSAFATAYLCPICP